MGVVVWQRNWNYRRALQRAAATATATRSAPATPRAHVVEVVSASKAPPKAPISTAATPGGPRVARGRGAWTPVRPAVRPTGVSVRTLEATSGTATLRATVLCHPIATDKS